ncbi:hypothetical protein [Loigolactobacillus coryniformis]|uniref:Uncharacterized protein n=1 Tax=Loigolactobacillus coryniformis subsp. torquens DSM 20004 = KCTC 3535 TaxID=1423822 RepID=A0A2D1KMK6_9LACO|nr:hypothetical protein [Loigolactobacillus coryniformis]ATO43377.1 hypothetical protein LC20004_05410 [Loigolactobacillus coryniformis subsp. torquens DSM 20004 = KCTC 3535]KRK85484.1 hypothetical protein FC16_GL001438 [Loigolactobacillus coryniformis subsp. torquens DSM 20004 = KCTC 3535]
MDYFLVVLLLIGFIVAIVGIVLLIIDFIKKNSKKISLIVIAIGALLFIFGIVGINVYVAYENNRPLVLKTVKKNFYIPADKKSITIPLKTTVGATLSAYDDGGSNWKLSSREITGKTTNVKVSADGSRVDAKFIEKLGDHKKTLIVSVYPPQVSLANSVSKALDSDNDSTSESSSSSKTVPFGTVNAMGNGSMAANLTMISAQQADPNDASVTDLSHNYPNLKQFVIVTYKVEALSDSIPTDTVDGAYFSYVDDQGSMGQTSSNRDPGTAESINKGQSITLRIGVGLENVSKTIEVQSGNVTFKGDIQ